ncbi:MAG: hypothetical protein M3Z01_04990 [Thermoproteota archaeon]|nr:hypothetical protein [Thermoproteota archaeon]
MTGEPLFCLEIWELITIKLKILFLLAGDRGYYGFFFGEYLTDLDLDCWTVLSTLLFLTIKIKLGPAITYLLSRYRSIALIAYPVIPFKKYLMGNEFRTRLRATL